jgi:catechol 2,3-dioxygenase-like lactoylglutathione lyase family enzyme
MSDAAGAPPRTGWARLAPEILVQSLEESMVFWHDVLGFEVAYQRSAERFVYLEHLDGAQIMLCQRHGDWETGPLERPFGRGVMFQVYVDDVDAVHRSVVASAWPVHTGPREVWRQHGDREGSQREFFLVDPDGYLVMIAQNLAERPLR